MAGPQHLHLPWMDTPFGTLTCLPNEYFLQHVLPPLPADIDPKRVLSRMLHSGSKRHRPITKDGRWRGFPKDPKQLKWDHDQPFVNFTAMVNAIAKAGAPRGVEPSLKAVAKKREWPRPSVFLIQPDVVPKDADWADIAVSGYLQTPSDVAFKVDVSDWSGRKYSS